MLMTAKLRTIVTCVALALGVWLWAGGAQAATECQFGVEVAQAAQSSVERAMRALRLAEGSSRACTESCIAQCRSAERSCGGKAECRAQFQICARRCVVSCGSR
jgi:hypothetical protein